MRSHFSSAAYSDNQNVLFLIRRSANRIRGQMTYDDQECNVAHSAKPHGCFECQGALGR